jgi:hypothetical protein
VNQFAIPVALKNIGWKTYIVYVIWCAVQSVILYFTIPETKEFTLEELDEVFHAKNPIKHSDVLRKLNRERALAASSGVSV